MKKEMDFRSDIQSLSMKKYILIWTLAMSSVLIKAQISDDYTNLNNNSFYKHIKEIGVADYVGFDVSYYEDPRSLVIELLSDNKTTLYICEFDSQQRHIFNFEGCIDVDMTECEKGRYFVLIFDSDNKAPIGAFRFRI